METNSTFSTSTNPNSSSLDNSLESSATIGAMATEPTHAVVVNESITEEKGGPVFTYFWNSLRNYAIRSGRTLASSHEPLIYGTSLLARRNLGMLASRN
jgi:hypothetical protein